MPTTAAELRSLLVRLSLNAEADLAALWVQLDVATASEGLFDVMPALVGDYGDTAATATVEWYDEHRDDLNISGRFVARLPSRVNLGADALAGWGAALAQKNFDTALPLISGGLVKRIMTASRDTMIENVDADPQARGWQRQARPGSCAFCQMTAGRGAVYRSSSSGAFAAHDSCGCVCVPAFGGRPVPVTPYTPSSRNITDADRARARAWIDANL